ncbi:hypothetical protein Fmac_011529 [Flemingia macrophylla]|uniref:RNA-directed DNA polymerase (Reverse transcriptase) n=1 Tax=Flemingia macrophylla TaxID=520843 RepID=A0ABD1MNI7_9FABA
MMDEVRQVVFMMDKNSAPGHDGFGSLFYQSYWSIICKDVYEIVLQFFNQG